MKKLWNRCDYCGKFVGFDDLGNGSAQRKLIYPLSEFTSETYETICKQCLAKEKKKMERVTKTFIFRDKKYSKRIYAVIATSLSDARTVMVGRGTLIKEDKNQDTNPSICITTNKAQMAIRELNNQLFTEING